MLAPRHCLGCLSIDDRDGWQQGRSLWLKRFVLDDRNKRGWVKTYLITCIYIFIGGSEHP
jgi:hypothetical protein